MEAVRVETFVQANGTVTIDNLPFSTGEKVEIIVLANTSVKTAEAQVHPFKGSPAVYLQDPFEPACPEEDWEVLR